jgi:hypothetical protein
LAYDPNQPRVPKGHEDGGEWTRRRYGAMQIPGLSDAPPEHQRKPESERNKQYAFLGHVLRGASALRSRLPFGLPQEDTPFRLPPEPTEEEAHRAIENTESNLALYSWLSARNTENRRAVAVFNARVFTGGKKGELLLREVRVLTREEVNAACNELDTVQRATNEAVRIVGPKGNRDPRLYGTDVHTWVKVLIDEEGNTRLEAELLLRWPRAPGLKGAIRLDVFEDASKALVCVYDVKTGTSGLSFERMQEIAERVFKKYPGVRFVVITEVRPANPSTSRRRPDQGLRLR